ncbi:hypothetical protein ACWGCW_21065, partial [Streptomyces sp. NPDC054933]
VLLAAAVGARSTPHAAELLRAVPAAASLWDVLVHHAVVSRALRHCRETPVLADRLRDASPLTGLLDRPTPSGETAGELLLEDQLLMHIQGRRLVTAVYSQPPASPGQSAWRGHLLDQLRMTERDFVLDVYEAALLTHAAGHLELVRAARRSLVPPPDLAAARPVALWWRALARLERSHRALLRARSGITSEYLAGVRLFRQVEQLEAITA